MHVENLRLYSTEGISINICCVQFSTDFHWLLGGDGCSMDSNCRNNQAVQREVWNEYLSHVIGLFNLIVRMELGSTPVAQWTSALDFYSKSATFKGCGFESHRGWIFFLFLFLFFFFFHNIQWNFLFRSPMHWGNIQLLFRWKKSTSFSNFCLLFSNLFSYGQCLGMFFHEAKTFRFQTNLMILSRNRPPSTVLLL